MRFLLVPFLLLSLSLLSFVLISVSVSSGIIQTPPPYGLVNAG